MAGTRSVGNEHRDKGVSDVQNTKGTKWPKRFPPLTPGQIEISNDFVQYWHQVLPRRYGVVDEFNHRYVVNSAPKQFLSTLEIGAGIGEHLRYEILTPSQEQEYVAVDIRQNMMAELRKRFPRVNGIVADCQERLNFDNGHFDRILAIHVLEHLPNLPAALREMHRVCNKAKGQLSIVIPCEGSMAYSLARRISAQRIFERRYKQKYSWFIEREHINKPREIFEELERYFRVVSARYFPVPLRLEFCNLCIGATLVPTLKPPE
jgi:ubiquinone/menaquinone biosynthesis C-methylase UbiE